MKDRYFWRIAMTTMITAYLLVVVITYNHMF